MVTTVELQAPFSYSWWVYLIVAAILLAALAIIIYVIAKLVKIFKVKKAVPPVPRHIKIAYISKVHDIQVAYSAGRLDKRDGYQRLSAEIRGFVHEATGINVENYTIKEVKAMGIRKLDELMEEYYVPEFAEDEKAKDKDLVKSCQAAMGVIKSWN